MTKVGIIGVGGIAQVAHIPSYQKVDGVKIVAVSDSNKKKAESVAKRFNIETYFTDYKDLLKLSEIEAVSICTPNFFHQEQVIASLRAGKNVLCEKPLCLNTKGVEQIFKEVKKADNKICMIAYMRRFMSISQTLKEFIGQGELGEIYYAKASYLRSLFKKKRNTHYWFLVYLKKNEWRRGPDRYWSAHPRFISLVNGKSHPHKCYWLNLCQV